MLAQAVAVVRHLLKGQQSDSEVLDDLAELLAAAPEEDLVLLSQGSCTGPSSILPKAALRLQAVYSLVTQKAHW